MSTQRPVDRRGTQDLGLLILRLGVGVILIVHGLQKAFGLWGGPGLTGWEDPLSTMGFKYADILTYVATGGQIAAGVLLVLGLFTPGAAAGALAYLVTGLLAEAMAAHEGAKLASFLTDGHEYQVFLACAVAAIILTVPAGSDSMPVAAGPGVRSSARSSRSWSESARVWRCGCSSTAATRWHSP